MIRLEAFKGYLELSHTEMEKVLQDYQMNFDAFDDIYKYEDLEYIHECLGLGEFVIGSDEE